MRGFFGIGLFHPKHEENQGTLWRSAFAFGASFIFTIGPRFRQQASDTPKAWHTVPMYQYESIADLKAHLPYACPLVAVELAETAQNLNRYVHPRQACYLLGAEDHGLPSKILNECHAVVYIEGLRVCLNVATTGSLVMFDRRQKEPKNGAWYGTSLRKAQRL